MGIGTAKIHFNWANTNQIVRWQNNTNHQLYLTGGVSITNGVTAGTTNAGVVSFKTPNTEYIVTMAGAGTMAAGATQLEPFLGVEILNPADAVEVHVDTAPTTAVGGFSEFTWMGGD